LPLKEKSRLKKNARGTFKIRRSGVGERGGTGTEPPRVRVSVEPWCEGGGGWLFSHGTSQKGTCIGHIARAGVSFVSPQRREKGGGWSRKGTFIFALKKEKTVEMN